MVVAGGVGLQYVQVMQKSNGISVFGVCRTLYRGCWLGEENNPKRQTEQ